MLKRSKIGPLPDSFSGFISGVLISPSAFRGHSTEAARFVAGGTDHHTILRAFPYFYGACAANCRVLSWHTKKRKEAAIVPACGPDARRTNSFLATDSSLAPWRRTMVPGEAVKNSPLGRCSLLQETLRHQVRNRLRDLRGPLPNARVQNPPVKDAVDSILCVGMPCEVIQNLGCRR